MRIRIALKELTIRIENVAALAFGIQNALQELTIVHSTVDVYRMACRAPLVRTTIRVEIAALLHKIYAALELTGTLTEERVLLIR
jgi:hypothetical protein